MKKKYEDKMVKDKEVEIKSSFIDMGNKLKEKFDKSEVELDIYLKDDSIPTGDRLQKVFENIDLTDTYDTVDNPINKSIEVGNTVFMCLSCSRYKIDFNKPSTCACGNPRYVINKNLKVV